VSGQFTLPPLGSVHGSQRTVVLRAPVLRWFAAKAESQRPIHGATGRDAGCDRHAKCVESTDGIGPANAGPPAGVVAPQVRRRRPTPRGFPPGLAPDRSPYCTLPFHFGFGASCGIRVALCRRHPA
jgi:hypothetical protein